MKKDDYLTIIMQVPPKQHIPITPFDVKTQREAFTVSAEGLKGVCVVSTINYSNRAHSLVSGTRALSYSSPRKLGKIAKSASVLLPHRHSQCSSNALSFAFSLQKEQRKLARAQVQGVTPGPLPSTPTAMTLPQQQSTPSHLTIPSAQQPPGTSQTSQAKPRVAPVMIPPPGSAGLSTATPTSATPRSAVPTTAPPQRTNVSAPSRGQKRELDDGVIQPPTPTTLSPNVPIGVVGARAGVGNARPRPIKKQRMVCKLSASSRETCIVPLLRGGHSQFTSFAGYTRPVQRGPRATTYSTRFITIFPPLRFFLDRRRLPCSRRSSQALSPYMVGLGQSPLRLSRPYFYTMVEVNK